MCESTENITRCACMKDCRDISVVSTFEIKVTDSRKKLFPFGGRFGRWSFNTVQLYQMGGDNQLSHLIRIIISWLSFL